MLTLYKQLSSGEALIFFGDSLTSQGLVCGSSEKRSSNQLYLKCIEEILSNYSNQ